MLRISIIAVILLLFSNITYSQRKGRCDTDDKMNAHEILHPYHLQKIERGFQNFNPLQNRSSNINTLYIPVHIIIVHDPNHPIGQGTNHSNAKIQSQIDALNKDFTRMNADTINTPAVFSQGNPNIMFCLANVDPNGNPSNGITRYPSSLNFEENEIDIKSATRWPRSEFLNIWVAEIEDLGFAYIPSTTSLPDENRDGVVIDHSTFGGPGTGALPPYNLGRTATHEVGHFLGLRHIWRSDGCNTDDGIADTPLQDTENFGCPVHPSPSCNNGGDMFMNFMDYVNDNCMNAFTEDQSEYMRGILAGIRSSLLNAGLAICTNAPLVATLEYKKDIDCSGNVNGEVKVKGFGGTPGYSYALNNTTNQSGLFTNLAKGNYDIIVTDSNNSKDTLSITIEEPNPITINEIVKNNLCFGEKKGSIRMGATGGTILVGSNYKYSKDGINFTFNPSFNSLENGTYLMYAKDNNDCTVSKNINITSPDKLHLHANIKLPTCYNDQDGKVTLDVQGGVSPFTYSSNNEVLASNIIDSLSAGTINISIKDFNNCALDTFITMSQPPSLILDYRVSNITCFGLNNGSIEIIAEGGIPPYMYSINNSSIVETNKFEGLAPNNYRLITQDSNGCISESREYPIIQPDTLFITNINLDSDENGKYKIAIEAMGGMRPYKYYIENPENIQTDSVIVGLSEGNYDVYVLDNFGCTDKKNVLISNVKEIDYKNEFSISPNPVIDNLAIKYFGNKEQEVKIEIFDISGKLLLVEEKIKFSVEKNNHNILVNNIANSILLIKIASKFKLSHILIFKE